MKRLRWLDISVWLSVILFSVCYGCAHRASGASLTIRYTVPAFDNDNGGSCAIAPIIVPASDSVFAYVEIAAAGIRDSLRVARSTAVSFTYTLPAALYTVRAYLGKRRASDGAMVYSCDTTAVRLAIAQPQKPELLP